MLHHVHASTRALQLPGCSGTQAARHAVCCRQHLCCSTGCDTPPLVSNLASHRLQPATSILPAVRILQKKLGWLDVSGAGEDGPWDVYWTDTSVSAERVMRLKPHQVGGLAGAGMLDACVRTHVLQLRPACMMLPQLHCAVGCWQSCTAAAWSSAAFAHTM